MKQYNVGLFYNELVLLDGKVNESAQKIIEIAKKEASYGFPQDWMNEVLRVAEGNGRLTWTFKRIRSCEYCEKIPQYWPHTRNGKWHRRGEPNASSPKEYPGVAFNEGFITFAGHGTCCRDCYDKHIGMLIDYILDHDMKIELPKWSPKPSNYRRDEKRICFSCGEAMYESEMGREMCLMGDGTYPATCPRCNAKSLLFGKSHKITNEYRMIPAQKV